jgi:hypothetical protein
MPNLWIYNFQGFDAFEGDPIQFDFTIINNGIWKAEGIVIKIICDALNFTMYNNSATPLDLDVDAINVSHFNYMGALPPGIYIITLILDPDNLINEIYSSKDGSFRSTWALDNLVKIQVQVHATATLDSDHDNLNNDFEINYGTNPFDPDTDHDGLNDYAEIFVYLTNATSTDTDADGLSDWEEIILFLTNPNVNDTDHDGYLDAIEISAGTNPLDAHDYPGKTSQNTNDSIFIAIIITGIVIAAGLVALGLLIRSRPVISLPPEPKQISPSSKNKDPPEITEK